MNSMRRVGALVLGLCLLAVAGCGNGSGSGGPSPGFPNGSLQVKIGDAPADRVVSFEITIDSVTLVSTSGNSVAALSTPTRVELTHLAGTVELLTIASVPPDTYASATINVSSPEVKIVDDVGQVFDRVEQLTTSTATVTFNPSLVVSGSTSSVLSLDFDMASALQLSGNDAIITPTFQVSAQPIAAQGAQVEEDGRLEDLKGRVTSVSTSSFTIAVEQTAPNLTFATDSGTEFEAPLTGVSSLSVGMLVEVDAVTQSDGSLLATKVEGEDSAIDLEIEGLVTQVTGAPATSFLLVVQDTAAEGTTMPAFGDVVTVNLSSTDFRVEDDDVDLTNLPFSTTFNENTLTNAQRVEADADVPSATSIVADSVKLKQQMLSGTVTAVDPPSGGQVVFTLSLPADSYFSLLTGQSTLTVVQQPSTELKDLSSVSLFQSVRVRGLVFFNGSTYDMVASRIELP